MNKRDKQEPDNQQSLIEIEDLTLSEDQSAELKGGPSGIGAGVILRKSSNTSSSA